MRIDDRNSVAGVHLRSCSPTRVGIAGASGRVVRAGRSAAGGRSAVFIDIDSLLRPVYGHAKQGASYGHTKIAGKQVLRKGLCRLATTISTRTRRRWSPGCGCAPARRFGQGRWAHGRRGDRHRRRRQRTRHDPGPRRQHVWVACGGGHVRGHGAEFSLAMTAIRDRTRDRRDSRGRMDTGALPGCGPRSRHRRLDL